MVLVLVALVVGFVAGILVGKNNKPLVDKIPDVKVVPAAPVTPAAPTVPKAQ